MQIREFTIPAGKIYDRALAVIIIIDLRWEMRNILPILGGECAESWKMYCGFRCYQYAGLEDIGSLAEWEYGSGRSLFANGRKFRQRVFYNVVTFPIIMITKNRRWSSFR